MRGVVSKLEGRKFGRLLIIKRAGSTKNKNATWECICDCGKIHIANSRNLIDGKTKSCGCWYKEHKIGKPSPNRMEYGLAAQRMLYKQYRHGALKRKLEFNLTLDELITIAKMNCYYCGSEPKRIVTCKNIHGEFICNGIDRLNSDIGYNLNNSVPCCAQCNYAKRTTEAEEFKLWIQRVYDHLKLGGN